VLGAVSLPASTWLFGAADIGRIAMLQTLTSFSIILFGLGLDQSYLREFHHAKNHRVLFWTAVWPGLVILGVVSLIALGFAPMVVAHAIFGVNNTYLAWVAVLTVGTAYCSRYFSLILRMEERGLAFSMSQLLPKLIFLGTLLLIYLLHHQHSFGHLLFAHVLGVVVAMVIFAWNTRNTWFGSNGEAPDNSNSLSSMLHYGTPLMVAGLAFWGLEALDKVTLRYLSSFTQLGNYSVAVGIASLAGTLSVLFTTIWIPVAYRWANEPDCAQRIEAVAHKLVAMASTLICMAGAFVWTLRFLLPKEYSVVQYLLCACMTPPVLYAAAEVTGIGVNIVRKSLPVMLIALVACAINLIGNLILIPLLGATGAAVSTAVAFFAMFLMRTELSMRKWVGMHRRKLYAPLGMITLLSILYAITGPRFSVVWMVVWPICAIVCVVLYREILTDLVRQLGGARKPAFQSTQDSRSSGLRKEC
jgi:O-antigen/teichoic acid export membrane protein